MNDALNMVHGTGASAYGPISYSTGVYGDTLCASGSQYSNLELDFGAAGSASSYPYVSQFPSYTEAGYSASGYSQAEVPFMGVTDWGLCIQVMQVFYASSPFTSITFDICAGNTTQPTYTSNLITSRLFLYAALRIVGATYFIPVPPGQLFEFWNFYAAIVGANPTTGTILAWFGRRPGDAV